MMEFESDSANPHYSALRLEIIPENPQDSDPGLVEAVGRDAADALRKDGYIIQLIYTGKKGGFLVEVLNFLTMNKDTLDITGALISISTPIVSVAKHILNAYEKRVGKELAQQQPIKITVEIDAALISLETSHLYLQETEKVAEELAKQLRISHPAIAAKGSPQTTIKVKGSVPKK